MVRFDPEIYPWLSVGMIAWGLLDCFLGFRVFKITVALWGILIGAFLGHVAAVAMGFQLAGLICGIVIGACLGGWLAFMLYLAAVFVAGLFFGLALGMLLFANYNPTLALVVGCGLGLICGYFAVKFQKVLLILSTSLVGALRALLALMFFTDRIDWNFYLFQQPQQIPALVDHHAWLMPATVILATVGTLTQFGVTMNEAQKKNRPEGKEKRK